MKAFPGERRFAALDASVPNETNPLIITQKQTTAFAGRFSEVFSLVVSNALPIFETPVCGWT
jgi:hypothetical protein